ncbi:transglutaminase-like domain-containing protein [Polaribacter litorisediminis]|uniref:transglutaminase-like domain-containing protein n=1 Tax=Polaribacter litorisediminis TaxID=1908341 RepID=UPI001CBFB2B9|nr:transglutaminase-like domain-containing protein [Polaribacter litorisediminis]UAM99111.1 transglutaminase-like domain-containing protein [Polaribacter litorisediminis]
MRYKLLIAIPIIVFAFFLNSCNSCSRSGRAKIIAMAKKEANKKNTIPEPNTIIKDIEPKIVKIEDIVTPKEKTIIKKELIINKIPPAVGNLIQVEGLVLKEVSELNIKLNTSGSQVEQIVAMQKHIFKNWHYIYDPITGKDTWRSAEATLSLKYKDQYSGDCDDFAILLASVARQIGLRSRMVGGFDGDYGHAFAEFLVPENEMKNELLYGADYRTDASGKWISLDWFKGNDHDRFTHNIKIFEDI